MIWPRQPRNSALFTMIVLLVGILIFIEIERTFMDTA